MKITILANVPVWILPGLEYLRHQRHYATWLEALVPALGEVAGEEHEIYWITMCKETGEDLTHHAYGQTFHILSRKSMAKQMLTGYVGEIRRICQILRNLKPDVVHAWGSEDVYGLAGAFCGNRNRLFTLQGCLSEYLRLLGGNFLFRLQTFYERPTVRRYQQATAESPGAAALLQDLNPKLQIDTVDYGVHPSFFEVEWQPAVAPEVLFIGSVTKRKGIFDLIEIAKRKELAHVNFKIAGEGGPREELEKHSPANVTWLGKCPRSEVIRHLQTAWTLVIPTYSDTGPTVVKEARIVGLPIVTTTGAGASSYVSSTGCGAVTAPGDLDGITDAIAGICRSAEHARATGARGWQGHREELHPRTTARKFLGIYESFRSPQQQPTDKA